MSNIIPWLLFHTGKTTNLEINENYFIASGLPADTEFRFEVCIFLSVWVDFAILDRPFQDKKLEFVVGV